MCVVDRSFVSVDVHVGGFICMWTWVCSGVCKGSQFVTGSVYVYVCMSVRVSECMSVGVFSVGLVCVSV